MKLLRLMVTCLICLVTAGRPATAQQAPSLPENLDQLMTAFTSTGLFNGVVLVAQDGKVLLKKGYGHSDLQTGKLNTAATKFAIYSITKPMTATLILQLAEKGLLRLDDKLSRFYPSLPAAYSITIEQLLTHTSGLYPYNNDYSMPTVSEDTMLQFLSRQPLRFRPGSQWQYCNTGYYLLGFIIEKLTRQSYATALESLLFNPLKMTHSGLNFRNLTANDKATGYQFLYPDSARQATLYDDNELRSAGGVWSTLDDLYRFHQGMQEYRLISRELTSKAYTPYQEKYGYGWFIDSMEGRRIISHSGGAAGFRTWLVRVPETNTCIVLLANAENIDVTAIKEQLLLLLLGKPYQLPVNIAIDPARLSAMAGVYQLEPGRSLYVTRVKDRLLARVSGQQPVLLLAATSDRFSVTGMNGYIKFDADREGVCDSVLLFRKGKKYTGPRVEARWGIVGSATPNGWNGPDIPLRPDSAKANCWIADSVTLKNGVIKLRYNNDWTFNFGGSASSSLLSANGNDMQVAAGTYKVILDLSDPERAVYQVQSIVRE